MRLECQWCVFFCAIDVQQKLGKVAWRGIAYGRRGGYMGLGSEED